MDVIPETKNNMIAKLWDFITENQCDDFGWTDGGFFVVHKSRHIFLEALNREGIIKTKDPKNMDRLFRAWFFSKNTHDSNSFYRNSLGLFTYKSRDACLLMEREIQPGRLKKKNTKRPRFLN